MQWGFLFVYMRAHDHGFGAWTWPSPSPALSQSGKITSLRVLPTWLHQIASSVVVYRGKISAAQLKASNLGSRDKIVACWHLLFGAEFECANRSPPSAESAIWRRPIAPIDCFLSFLCPAEMALSSSICSSLCLKRTHFVPIRHRQAYRCIMPSFNLFPRNPPPSICHMNHHHNFAHFFTQSLSEFSSFLSPLTMSSSPPQPIASAHSNSHKFHIRITLA